MSIFICPVCGGALEREKSCFRCERGHSFDISAQGYVNLMPSGKARGNAGDSAEMMAARTRFLNSGAYGCLKDALAGVIAGLLKKQAAENPLVVDAGCGEGYYTAGIAKALQKDSITARVAGIDIAKRGVKSAAKRDSSASFAVAGIFDMPFPTGGAAVVTSVFAPLCPEEFNRVLAPGGTLFVVSPGKNHLFGLKQAVYDTPYLNDEEPFAFECFKETDRTTVHDDITVKGQHIRDLFMMTPYFWNTPQEQAKRLDGLERIDTSIDFIITELQKTGR